MKLRKLAFLLFITLSWTGCSILSPPVFEYRSTLAPDLPKGEGYYSVQDDGSMSYDIKGLRIDVRYLVDRELDDMFPDESSREEFSFNPYTYGNWVDPEFGYTPNRFTVFKATVYNYTYAKVELDPLEAILLTDRGDVLHSYGIQGTVPYDSFEKYYRARRGQSGNEYYRYDMRMGLVRSYNYAQNEKIFKGENYGGFIVFDPLPPEVKRVRLILKDFVLKFDAFEKPLETVDIPFDFDRGQEVVALERGKAKGVPETEKVKVAVVSGPDNMEKRSLDMSRSPEAITSVVKANLGSLKRCFLEKIRGGEIIEGKTTVGFTILPGGLVNKVNIVKSDMEDKDVEKCITEQIGKWRFKPMGISRSEEISTPETEEGGVPEVAPLETTKVMIPLIDMTVSYTFEFRTVD